jgi:tRNA modification GTPase
MVQQALVDQGCRPIAWQAWALESGDDPIRAAALVALAEARTERTAAILLDQYQGALSRALGDVRGRLERNDLEGAGRRLEQLLERAPLGLHLVEPWRVVVAGPPNAGKSTLLNAMAGYARAIVDPQAGTTRDLVTAFTALEGWPVELGDTAGLREAADPVERAGVDVARRSLAAADLALLVFDLSQPWSAADAELLAAHPEAIVVHNKADLAGHADSARPAGRHVSALHKDGIEGLLHAIATRLVPDPPEPGTAVPFTPEQVDALVRASQVIAAGDTARARHVLDSLAPAAE